MPTATPMSTAMTTWAVAHLRAEATELLTVMGRL